MSKLEMYKRLAEQGYTQTNAAAIMGVSRQRVNQMAKKHGLKFARTIMHNPVLRDEIKRLHKQGCTINEIAAATGQYRQVIDRNMRQMGLPIIPERKKYDEGIRRLIDEGLTQAEIARRLGTSPVHVMNRRKAMGLECKAKYRSR